MKALFLACLGLVIGGCAGPSRCERKLVPINGRTAAQWVRPGLRPLKPRTTRGAEHEEHRP